MTFLSKLAFPMFATAAVFASAAIAGPGDVTFTTVLTGAAEVPGPGDPDGSGSASVTVRDGVGRMRQVCYEISVSDIAPATLAHIHRGSAVQAGPIVVHLEPPTDGTSSGCASVTGALAEAIVARPHLYYVNVHNADFPAGAVRGQLD
jgi:hypothetical protein